MTSGLERRAASRRTSQVTLRGCDLDEDMWDRVVAHWHQRSARASRASTRLERIRRALCARTLELRLVLDGPRLLTVAAVIVKAQP